MTVYCSLVPAKDATPPNFAEKILQIATKPQNLQKFSPSNVSCCTVYNWHNGHFVTHFWKVNMWCVGAYTQWTIG